MEEKLCIAKAICTDVQEATNANIPLILAQETENSYSDEEYWSEPKED
jgi:hypothetical protein